MLTATAGPRYRAAWATVMAALAVALAPTPANAAGQCTAPQRLGVVFVVDDSGSMTSNDPGNLRGQAVAVGLDQIPTGALAAATAFATDSRRVFGPTEVTDAARPGLQQQVTASLASSGGTNYERAFLGAKAELDGMGAADRRAVVFLSDGVTSGSFSADQQIAAAGVPIYTIGLGTADRDVLAGIATRSGGTAFDAGSAGQLQAIFARIISSLTCDAQTVTESFPLTPGQTRSIPFDVAPGDGEFRALAAWSGGGVTVTAGRPDGSAMTPASVLPGEGFVSQSTYALLTGRQPQPGRWRLDVQADAGNTGAVDVTIDVFKRQLPPLPDVPAAATAADGRRPTAATVICNRGPLPTDSSRCTVTVADAGPPARIAPSGSVRWTATSGQVGGPCRLASSAYGPGISSCAVTFRPGPAGTPGGTVLPVTAHYDGSAIHLPVSRAHSLIDASIIDPGTGERGPSPSQCRAIDRAGAAARGSTPRINTKYQDPSSPYYQEGFFDRQGRRIAWCAETGLNTVKTGGGTVLVGGLGAAWVGGWTALGGAAGLEVGGPLGAAGGGGVGFTFGLEYGGKQAFDTVGDIWKAADRAQVDPPDRRYRKLVRTKRTRVPRLRAARSSRGRADRRLQRSWLMAIGQTGALADALARTLDKAGGAERAGSRTWERRQMRHAISLARRLAERSDRVAVLTARIERRARRRPETRRRSSVPRLARLRSQIARRGFTKRQIRVLSASGFDRADRRRLRAMARDRKIKTAKLVLPPRTILKRLHSTVWRDAAVTFRLWTQHPSVIAAAGTTTKR